MHPGDEYALLHENEYGKSEMWYVIDCEPDSCIYCGFKEDVSRETVMEHLKDDTILSLLNRVQVKKGETYFIPAGTIHAIGKGNLICEVQQNSNSTYRVFDYNRTDRYGNKRKLDIDKALDVLDYRKYEGADVSMCKYFECRHCECEDSCSLMLTDESFVSVMILDGFGRIQIGEYSMEVRKGDCIFIPQNRQKMTATGRLDFLTVRI